MNKTKIPQIVIVLVILCFSIVYTIYKNNIFCDGDIVRSICENPTRYKENNKDYVSKVKNEINSTKNDIDKNFLKGYLYFYESNYNDAQKYFKLVIEDYDKTNNIQFKICNGKLLTESLINQGQKAEALIVIKNTFNLIPTKEYKKLYEDIWELISLVVYIDTKSDFIITSINTILDSGQKLGTECELYLFERLSFAYDLIENYSLATSYKAKAIALANTENDSYKEALFKVDLATLVSQLENYDYGEKTLKDALSISIDDVSKNAEVKLYAYSTLMLVYIKQEKYDAALLCANKIDQYKGCVDTEIYNDIDILKEIFKSMVFVEKNELEKAKGCLDRADKLSQKDEEMYIIGKEVYYYMALGKYDEKIGNYEKAEKSYLIALEESEKNNLHTRKIEILEGLISVFDKQGSIENKAKYQKKLIEEDKKNKSKRNEENIIYILDKVSSEVEAMKIAKRHTQLYSLGIISITIIIPILFLLIRKTIKSTKQSYIDGLTGIYNRRYFDKIYKYYIDKNEDFAVVIIDIDNFKQINDSFGHEFGDIVIRGVVGTIKNLLQDEDKIFRYGGEEFVILVYNKSIEDTYKLAEKLRSAVELNLWREETVVTISIGISKYKENENTLETADKNLYIAKERGKNNVV